MFKKNNGKSERAPLVGHVLRKISSQQQAVRIEIDAALARFNTGILLRDGLVLVGKPEGLDPSLKLGDTARFRIPWNNKFEVRMETVVLHLNLKNGTEVFVCKSPTGRAHAVRRTADRFNTSRFRNLHLRLPALNDAFPIVDLSAAGCRVEADPKLLRSSFGVGPRIWEGLVHVKDKLQVQLDLIIPRVYHEETVGLEFKVNRRGNHERKLSTLLGILAMGELNQVSQQPS